MFKLKSDSLSCSSVTHSRTSAEPSARRPSCSRPYCALAVATLAVSAAAMMTGSTLSMKRRLRWMTTSRPARERLYWLVYNIEGKSKYTLPSRRYMLPPLANSVVCLVQIYIWLILIVRPAYQTERRRYAAVCVWMDNPFCWLNIFQPIQPTSQNLSLWAGVICIFILRYLNFGWLVG